MAYIFTNRTNKNLKFRRHGFEFTFDPNKSIPITNDAFAESLIEKLSKEEALDQLVFNKIILPEVTSLSAERMLKDIVAQNTEQNMIGEVNGRYIKLAL